MTSLTKPEEEVAWYLGSYEPQANVGCSKIDKEAVTPPSQGLELSSDFAASAAPATAAAACPHARWHPGSKCYLSSDQNQNHNHTPWK